LRCTLLIAALASFLLKTSAQDTVEIVEKTIKVPALSSTTEYFGFAAGDRVIINCWVEKGKELKSISFTEYPGTTRFAQHEFERIEDKVLVIERNSIFKVEYSNAHFMPRIVQVRLQRIPRDASTLRFNTGVQWVDRVDTIYQSQETGYNIRSDTTFLEVLNTTARVNSRTSADNTHRTLIDFTLPAGTVRWSYWIGVGEEGLKLYGHDEQKYSAAGGNAVHPLREVILGLHGMTQVKVGDNIRYFFISKQEETEKFLKGAGFGQFRQGDMVADYGLMNYANKNDQKYFIGLSNDSPQSRDVHVKIMAMVVVRNVETTGEKISTYNNSRVPVHAQAPKP